METGNTRYDVGETGGKKRGFNFCVKVESRIHKRQSRQTTREEDRQMSKVGRRLYKGSMGRLIAERGGLGK